MPKLDIGDRLQMESLGFLAYTMVEHLNMWHKLMPLLHSLEGINLGGHNSTEQ